MKAFASIRQLLTARRNQYRNVQVGKGQRAGNRSRVSRFELLERRALLTVLGGSSIGFCPPIDWDIETLGGDDDEAFITSLSLSTPTGDTVFDQYTSVATGLSQVQSVRAVDMNLDGSLDVLATWNGGTAWWEGSGSLDGTWDFHRAGLGGVKSGYLSGVDAGDFDNDGDMDIALALSEWNEVDWLENLDGTATSWSNPRHSLNDYFRGSQGIRAGDIDDDGDSDFVVAAGNYEDVTWWRNNGGGTFSANGLGYSEDGGHYNMDLADLDGNGYLDIIDARHESVSIHFNENGSFSSTRYVHVGSHSYYGTSGDFDGDGDLDVLGSFRNGTINWYENNGSRQFPTTHPVTNLSARWLATGDFDGDGDTDFASAAGDTISWWENAGSGTGWTEHVCFSDLTGASSVAAADLDGDGDLDLVATGTGGEVRVLENSFSLEAGFTVTETGGSTSVSETGTTDSFSVVLDVEPLTDVVITVVSEDTGEATVDETSLTFTPSNWDTPQAVTVTGVDDLALDGDQATTITLSVDEANTDDAFDGLADQAVTVTTTDDDVAIYWDGEAGDLQWSTALNWSTDSLPTSTDCVVIDVAEDITVEHASAATSVYSLDCTEGLNLSGGALMVAGESTVSGALTLAPGTSLTASGIAASFVASGATVIDGANLYALDGGRLDLSEATGYVSGDDSLRSLVASGADSLLDLSGVTVLEGTRGINVWTYVNALDGGKVDLSGAGQLTRQVHAKSSGTGSVIDLNSATTLDGSAGTTSHNRMIIDLYEGASVLVSNVTALNTVTLRVYDGETLSLPKATSYTGGENNHSSLAAAGTDSVLDLSNVSLLDGTDGINKWTYVNAIDGGKVDLSGAGQLTRQVHAKSSGAGSAIDLSSATILDGSAGTTSHNRMIVDLYGGSSVLVPNVTALNTVTLRVYDGETLSLPKATSYTGGDNSHSSLAAVGANSVLDLSTVSLLDGTDGINRWTYVNAIDGGKVDLSDAEQVTRQVHVTATGTGSIVDLDSATVLDGSEGTTTHNPLLVELFDGGTVYLPNVTTLNTVGIRVYDGISFTLPAASSYSIADTHFCYLTASGANSVLDLSHVTQFEGSRNYWVYVDAVEGGMVDLSAAEQLTRQVHVTSTGTGSVVDLDSAEVLDGSAGIAAHNPLLVELFDGGTVHLPNVTTLNTVGIRVYDGISFALPAATSYSIADTHFCYLTASGANSVLDLSHVTQFEGSRNYWVYVDAVEGGTVDLSAAEQLTRQVHVTSTGTGSVVDLDSAEVLDGSAGIAAHNPLLIELFDGGTVHLPNVTTLNTVGIRVYDGISFTLPAASSYSIADTHFCYLTASGANSVLDLSHVTQFEGSRNYWVYVDAVEGGMVDLSAAEQLTRQVHVTSTGTGSVVDLTSATSLDGSAGVASHNPMAFDLYEGATIQLPNVATLNTVTLRAYDGETLTLPSVISYTCADVHHCSLAAVGAATVLSLPNLAELEGVSGSGIWTYITALEGGKVDLSSVVSATRQLSVAIRNSNSVVDLSNANTLESPGGLVELTDGGLLKLNSTDTTVATVPYIALDSTSEIEGNLEILGSTVLRGAGTIEGNLANAAEVRPGTSPGTLTITGDYTQTADGTLSVEIGGTAAGTEFDQMVVSGTAKLDGTLAIARIDEYAPSAGESFRIIDSGSREGKFAELTGTGIGSEAVFTPSYLADGVVLNVAPVVYWDGEAGDLQWNTALNWSTDSLPTSTDYVVIDVVEDITVEHGSGATTIYSLQCAESLNHTGGSLNLSGSSVVEGTLTLGGGNLNIVGAWQTFEAGGSVTINGSSLNASGGALLDLSNATGYKQRWDGNNSVTASGAGSKIDLSGVITFEGSTQSGWNYRTYVEAIDGGIVDLSSATSATGNASYMAEGAGSLLDLTSATSIAGGNQSSDLRLRAGAEIRVPNVTTLNSVGINVSDGETLAFPSATSYASADRMQCSIYATGAGSRIDLSEVTTFSGAKYANHWIHVDAIDGGYVDLSSVDSVTRQVEISASGTGSIVDLTVATTLDGSDCAQRSSPMSLTLYEGGEIRVPNVTTLATVSLGASDGETLSLPSATSYASINHAQCGLYATGVGSRLDLAGVTSFSGAKYENHWTTIRAVDGGFVNLSNVASVTRQVEISAQGMGSVVDLTATTELNGSDSTQWSSPMSLTLFAGGEIRVPNVTTLATVSLVAREGETLSLPLATSYVSADPLSCSVTASGAGSRVDLSGVTTFSGARYKNIWTHIRAVDGGNVDLSEVGSIARQVRIEAAGANSTIDLSNCETVALDAGGNVTLSDGSLLGLNDTGTTVVSLSSITLDAASTITGNLELAGSTVLLGAGTVEGNLINGAEVRPGTSPGTLTITGNYTQTAGGTLAIEIGGTNAGTEFDQVFTSGQATLDGTLAMTLLDGYVPTAADSFEIVTAASRTGSFAHVTQTPSDVGIYLSPSYTATSVIVSASPIVYWDGDAGDFDWNNGLNWSSDVVPGVGDRVVIDVAEEITVNHDSGTATIHSLQCAESLNHTGGSLNLSGSSVVEGTLTLQNGYLSIQGEEQALGASGAVTLNNCSLSAADGATLDLSTATSYEGATDSARSITATGEGSRIDLSGVTSFIGTTGSYTKWVEVDAIDGGCVDLSGMGSATRQVAFTSEGAGSMVDLTSATVLDGSDSSRMLSVVLKAGGEIRVPNVETLATVSLGVRDGETLSFPSARSYTCAIDRSASIWATDVGSRIDLSSLETLSGTVSNDYWVDVNASNGGFIDLSSVNMVSRQVAFAAENAGSVIDLTSATAFDGSAPEFCYRTMSVVLEGGAEIRVPNVETLANVTLGVRDGETLSFPSATTYSTGNGRLGSVWATGVGSRIDLCHLTSFSGTVSNDYWIGVNARDGAYIDLSGVDSVTRQVRIDVDGANSSVDLSGCEAVTIDGNSYMKVSDGGLLKLNDTGTTVVSTSSITLHAASTISGNLELGGSTVLLGAGTVEGDLINGAEVRPGTSPGTLTITGDYTQTADGTLAVEIGGTSAGSEFDRMVVSGNAQLDGTLGLSYVDGFTPQLTDTFQIVTGGAVSGEFFELTGGAIDGTHLLAPRYEATNVTLHAVEGVYPTIGNLSVSPNPVDWQNRMILTVDRAADANGRIAQVEFYHDADNDGELHVGADTLLGIDDEWVDGWSLITTADIPLGMQRLMARAVDDDGLSSPTSMVTVSVEDLDDFDLGDAPSPYPTLLSADGARHIAMGPTLGSTRDREPDGQPSAAADGDGADEDGVTFATMVAGSVGQVTVDVRSTGNENHLDGWIDFDADGVWSSAEQILVNQVVSAGMTTFSFPVPADAACGVTFARFRLSTAGGLMPEGLAEDGEVEDYAVTVLRRLNVDLPAGSGGDDIVVRRNGENVEVFDRGGDTLLASSPLAYTESVQILGANDDDDKLTVDYAAGGFFALRGGVVFQGGMAGHDHLVVVGDGLTTARYESAGAALGDAVLEITGSGQEDAVRFTGVEPLTINGMLHVEIDGQLHLGAENLTVGSSSLTNLGTVTTMDGGVLTAPGGVALGVGDSLVGRGTVAGRVAAATGTTIRATGNLQLGDAGSFAGFFSDGELYTGNHTVTILDRDIGVLGSLTEIGNATGAGTLTAANGLLLEAGKTMSGYGAVNGDFVNQGHVLGEGPLVTDGLEFTGDVSGAGSFDGNILFSGTYSPGNSPAEVDFFDNVAFAESATLVIELGGTLPDESDALHIANQATLAGTLDVVLLPGYTPEPGDSFEMITAGLRVGDFAVKNLPDGLRARWDGNLLVVETQAEVVSLDGTSGSDTIVFEVGTSGGAPHRVNVNGSVTTYDAASHGEIRIDGLGGSDKITVVGADQDEVVTLELGALDILGEHYELHATNIDTITVDAGAGDDTITMTGSGGSNRLYSRADSVRFADSARSYSFRAEGFETVTVNSPGTGRDYAYLYDAPGKDELDVNPERAILTRGVDSVDETVTTASGFERVYAYATPGGTDGAKLTGAEGARNRFYGYADYGILTESRRSFYFYARGFDAVTGESPGSGYAYAYLYDSSGVDELEATPSSATMDRAEPWTDTTAKGFMRVYVYSTRGGDDTAELTGAATGGNLYRGYPTYSTLTDSARSFYHYARGFTSVTAIGSVSDTSSDRAYVYDSRGDDTYKPAFHDGSEYQGGYLTDGTDSETGTYENWVKYFDLVYARSSDRGTDDKIDVADENELAYNLIRSGTWD